MALTDQDLQFNLIVDSKGAIKGITDATGKLIDLSGAAKETEGFLSKLGESFGKVGAAIVVFN